MVTRDRFDLLQKSLYCYTHQTYKNKELLILNEGPKSYQHQIKDYVDSLNRDDIRYEFLNGKYTLGELRNIAIGLSYGDLFVQWDDDDFCTPKRLSIQFDHLRKHPNATACFLSDQLHYFYDLKLLYWHNWLFNSGGKKKHSLIPGTIMAWKNKLKIKYPPMPSYEDTIVTNTLCERSLDSEEVILLSGFGFMHVYTYHGKNVYSLKHHMGICASRACEIDHLIAHRKQICQTIKFLNFGEGVQVMGRCDRKAFVV